MDPDQLLDVERLPATVGDTVELLDVLLLSDGEKVTIGEPTVAGARVLAEVVEHGRDKKIVVFKYKSKTRYHKKTGHRQSYTRLAIRQILTGEEPEAAPKAPPKRRRRAAPKAAAEPAVETAMGPSTEAAPAAAEAPKRRRRAAPKAAAEPPADAAEAAIEPSAEVAPAPAEAPKRRRRKAAKPETAAPEEAPKRRTRKAATPKASAKAKESPKPRAHRPTRAKKEAEPPTDTERGE